MVSAAMADEIRAAALARKSFSSLRRADSLKTSMETSLISLFEPVVVELDKAPERPATAPEAAQPPVTTTENTYADDFFTNLLAVFQPANNATHASCVACGEAIENYLELASQAITTGCVHWLGLACESCMLSTLKGISTAPLKCPARDCSEYVRFNTHAVERQLDRWALMDPTSDKQIQAKETYTSDAFRSDWSRFSERIEQFEVGVFYCCVCGERKNESDIDMIKKTSSCMHEHLICTSCYGSSIMAQFDERMWDGLICPQCGDPASPLLIKEVINKERFEKYDTYLISRHLQKTPDFHWCPYIDCSSGQIVDDPTCNSGKHEMTCNACKRVSCTRHNAPHSSKGCTKYSRRNALSKLWRATDRTVWRITKSCPGENCTARIQKNSGCSHMTCKFFEFS